jgi:predicted MFS family arabinose efflux permease
MKLSTNKKFILYLLAAMNFVHIVDFMIMMPLGDYLMKLFEISPAQFGALVSAYTFSAGISGFFAAFFIDRFDRRKAILTAFSGLVAGTFLIALANSYALLIAARIFTGLFGGLIGTLVLSMVSDLFSFQERGRAMGIVTTAFAFASVVGVPLGLYLASKLQWHAPFVFLGVVGTLLLIAAWRILPPFTEHLQSQTKRNPLQVLSTVAKDKNQLRALALSTFIVLGQFMVIPFLAPYMIRNVGFTPETITLIYMLGGGAVVFSGPQVGKLTDRIGAKKVFVIFMLLSFIPLLIITHLPQTSIYIALIFSTLFFIFVNGRIVPAQTLTTAAVHPATRGSFMSFQASLQQLSASLAAFLSGLILVENELGFFENYNWVGYTSVLISSVSLFIVPRLKVAAGN